MASNDTVWVPVLPSFKGFSKDMEKGTKGAGTTAGEQIAKELEAAVSKSERAVSAAAAAAEKAQNRVADATGKVHSIDISTAGIADAVSHQIRATTEIASAADEMAVQIDAASNDVEALGLGPVAVAGHSMGSLITGGLAVDHPDLVSRAAILNGVHRRTPDARAAVLARAAEIARIARPIAAIVFGVHLRKCGRRHYHCKGKHTCQQPGHLRTHQNLQSGERLASYGSGAVRAKHVEL